MLRVYNVLVGQYQPKLNSVDIEFGQAFHKFIQTMRLSGGNYAAGIKAAVDHFTQTPFTPKSNKRYMTEHYLTKVCLAYWEHYADGKDELQTLLNPEDNRPCVEFKFSWPYYTSPEFDVFLAGTIDDICRVGKNGRYCIRDYKTTSMWNQEDYFRGYRLSAQLMFYRFMLERYAELYPQGIFAEVARTGIGCIIDGIFLAGESKEPSFKRSEVFFYGEQQMEEFAISLENKLGAIVDMLRRAVTLQQQPIADGMLTGGCVTNYGMCKYFSACSAPDKVAREHILRHNFASRPYTPLEH